MNPNDFGDSVCEKIFTAQSRYKRLDVFLAECCDKSRSHIKKLADEGMVTKNGLPAKAADCINIGDVVTVLFPAPQVLDLTPQNIPIDIIYQDDDLAVINKPQGLTVHSGGGTNGGTLVNALLYHLDNLSQINGVIRPGIVHRIDKDTSGLLVVAKNDKAHISLSEQIRKKEAKRIYIALLEGVIKDDNGLIDTLITRSDRDRKMMAASNTKGRRAVTEYEVLKRFKDYTLCKFSLKTGRTHQIRVHAKYIGHPVVGDRVYGYKKQKFDLKGQLLHAYELSFVHPTTGKRVTFNCPLPDYFEKVLSSLK